jgi:hypothetical protein
MQIIFYYKMCVGPDMTNVVETKEQLFKTKIFDINQKCDPGDVNYFDGLI